MKRLLICLILAFLQLSQGLPLEGSVKTGSAPNSAMDGSKLVVAASPQAQVPGQLLKGSQAVNEVHATSGGQQTYGVAQAAPAGAAQEEFSGQAFGVAPFQLSGVMANQPSVNTQAVGEAQAVGGAQANGEAQAQHPGQVAVGAQTSTGGAQANGGTQGQVPEQTAVNSQAQISGQVAGVAQPAGETQVNGNAQSQLSVQASGALQPQITKPSAVGEAPAAEGVVQTVGGAHAPEGNQAIVLGQAYLSGQANGGAQSQLSETQFGEAQTAGGVQVPGGSQTNGEVQDLQEAASNQAPAGAAQEGSISLSPSLQQSQEGMQVSRNEPSSQISKQSQPQIIGRAVSSNLPINESGSLGQNNVNSGAQAGVGTTA